MKTVSSNVPWPCECLVQALCVNWLLNRQALPWVTYLGASLEAGAQPNMKAHAWVCVGPHTIIGDRRDQFPIVGTFTSSDLSEFE
ncbi:transglutaminase superfamily protein [Arenicella xantha]|uniref:Transglutaminase superfamily protein n=2 Tax=Arenicella xantha TaxID=644221 RepID=A0A395JIG9_9GAMM|nr:transglutaminase superfamily protein [Arenicella xantha]